MLPLLSVCLKLFGLLYYISEIIFYLHVISLALYQGRPRSNQEGIAINNLLSSLQVLSVQYLSPLLMLHASTISYISVRLWMTRRVSL
jgi:hypothetical protein